MANPIISDTFESLAEGFFNIKSGRGTKFMVWIYHEQMAYCPTPKTGSQTWFAHIRKLSHIPEVCILKKLPMIALRTPKNVILI